MKKLFLLLPFLTVACTMHGASKNQHDADYWQRVDSTSALYLRGPKAQHQLHKDISSCVSETKELSRLGTIRNANPPAGIEMNENLAEKWQSPRGDGPLYTEFRDFHDFESCMNFKGWERTNFVKDTQIENAKMNYNTTILGENLNSRTTTYSRGSLTPSSHNTNYNN